MAVLFISGPTTGSARRLRLVLALLLFAVLCPCARADTATLRRCANTPDYRRVLEAGRDDVTTLNLIGCVINQSQFESNAFDGAVLPNLKEILLPFNNLEHLTPGIFNRVAQIKRLDLSHNKLREVPVCDVLSPLPILKELELHSNRIATISESTFSTCMKLQRLILDNNVIKYVHPTAFSQMPDLKIINLNNNNITSISDTMFNIRSLETLEIAHNLIEYVSPRAFSGTKLTTLYLQGNRISFLPAYFMSDFNNAGGHLEYYYFATNPWNCACLLEHIADAKRADERSYSYWFYDGRWPTCVFSGRQACHRHLPSPLLPQLNTGLESN